MKYIFLFIAAMTVALFIPHESYAEPPVAFKKCQMCHGKQLEGKKKSPSLSDRSYDELYKSLTVAVPKKMTKVVAKLTEKEKQDIATYIFKKVWMDE